MDLKSTSLRILNQHQQNIFAIFFSYINLDVHVSTKVNLFTIDKVGLGDREILKKKSNEMEASPLGETF